MQKTAASFLLCAALLAPFGYAKDAADTADPQRAAGDSPQAQSLSEGEVRKVDKDAKKITVRHGPLANLDMPAMTMVFRVKDPALLEQVKAGDKVRFQAEKIDGAFTITAIQPVQ